MIDYLGVSAVARRLGLSYSRVSQMVAAGQLPTPDAQIADRVGWTEATIERWEAKRDE